MTHPPTGADMIYGLRDGFRTLRKRCRIKEDGFLVEDWASRIAAAVWPGVARAGSRFPVQWSDIAVAKRFLHGFVVSISIIIIRAVHS